MSFALCSQFNQVDQIGLIKAHPFLLGSKCIYQWKLVSQLVPSFCTKNIFSYLLCKIQDQNLFYLFLSTVLHSFPFLHFYSSFFLQKLCGSSIGDDHGRLKTQSIQGSIPIKAEFQFWFSISNMCECSSFSSILFSIFMIMNMLMIENELVQGFLS